jgi:hypothetical protein
MKWLWLSMGAVVILLTSAFVYVNWFYDPCRKGCVGTLTEPHPTTPRPN